MSEFLGKVYFDNDFAFVDGTSGEKIIIVVGESDKRFLLCKTTSQSKRYLGATPGCCIRHNCFMISKIEQVYSDNRTFPKSTYIQFDTIFESYDKADLIKKGIKGQLSNKGVLKREIIISILQCLIKSEDIEMKFIKILENHITNIHSYPVPTTTSTPRISKL